MRDLSQKVSYLQGLAEGMELESTSKEGKVITKMLDLLEDIADEFKAVHMYQEETEEYLEAMDEDLADLEVEFYDDEDDDDDEYDFDEELIEVQCPNCGETIYFDDEYLDEDDMDEVPCPNCGETLYFDNDDLLEDYVEDGDDE